MDTWKWIFERWQHKQISFLETKILKAQIQTCQSFINKVQLTHQTLGCDNGLTISYQDSIEI